MRKFIISDLHGDGNVYKSIMSYLDNLSKNEEIALFINGDLIDRGLESAEMLLDIKRRVEENNYPIIYLGGNHELMMHEVFEKRKKGIHVFVFDDWFNNGGNITDYGLEEKLDYDKDKIYEVADFVSNLRIYHKFEEKINGKPIVLVHAACLPDINLNKRIKDNDGDVFYSVWTRKEELYQFFGNLITEHYEVKLGNDEYFTIVGHTSNNSPVGVEYDSSENCLNIDGGAGLYVEGIFEYDHIPLLEICDNYLKVLTFNNNNQITHGNYFKDGEFIPFTLEEIEFERSYLDHEFKPRKLIKINDGTVEYIDYE